MTNVSYPQKVTVVEVGPRDGLQSEAEILPEKIRIEFINLLSATGLAVIEVGSLVSPKWVPQMANSAAVFAAIQQNPHVAYPMLVPNEQGLAAAVDAGVKEIAVFTAASETFSQKNVNCSMQESLQKAQQVTLLANKRGLRVRAYLSCVLGCPYEGEISDRRVAAMAAQLLDVGCYQVSLGDTIGIGTPLQTENLLTQLLQHWSAEVFACHFHDTYGQALANCLLALQLGISTFDSSVAGLGGCPYAKGASGNLATEDLLFMLHGMGIKTGVVEKALRQASQYICRQLQHLPRSNAARALNMKSE